MKKLLVILSLLSSFCFGQPLAPPLGAPLNYSHTLSQGLIGEWLCNEAGGQIAYDSRGGLNNGTLSNGAVYKIAQHGSCVSFDGTNDLINVGDIATFDKTFTQFSVSIWINSANVSTGFNKTFIGKMGGAGQRGWQFVVLNGGTVDWDMWTAGGGTEFETITTATLTANTWYHLVGVFSGGVYGRVFINGVLSKENTTTPIANTNGSNTASLRIGDRGDGSASLSFNGMATDAKIYNRILSPTEVRQLYLDSYSMFVK